MLSAKEAVKMLKKAIVKIQIQQEKDDKADLKEALSDIEGYIKTHIKQGLNEFTISYFGRDDKPLTTHKQTIFTTLESLGYTLKFNLEKDYDNCTKKFIFWTFKGRKYYNNQHLVISW